MIRGLGPRAWRGWSAYVLGLGTFIVLNVLVVLGTVAGLFALLFALYLLIEYVAVLLIRSLAV